MSNERLEALLRLEENRRVSAIMEGRERLQKEISALVQDSFTRGKPMSADEQFHVRHEKEKAALKERLLEFVSIRVELAKVAPELASTEQLSNLREQIKNHVSVWVQSRVNAAMSRQPFMRADEGILRPQFQREAARAEQAALLTLQDFELSVKVGVPSMNENRSGNITVQNYGGSVAVNAGTVLGDVQAIVGDITKGGNGELGEALKLLADVVFSQKESGECKTENLELVKFIGDQALGHGPRNITAVRTAFEVLRARLSDVADLAQIVGVAGPIIAKHFGWTWP